jgi:hypothetical protein
VQGISIITRCAATRPLDGAYRGVLFNKDDKLCLDGQRLVQTTSAGDPISVSGTPQRLVQSNDAQGIGAGLAAREFRTEKDSYSRVRAYGSAKSNVDFGPAGFTVWTKSGLKYEYGRVGSDPANMDNALVFAEGSEHAAVWAVRRISDASGNFMLFEYQQRVLEGAGGWGSRTSDSGSVNAREWNLKHIHYTGRISTSSPYAIQNHPVNRIDFEYTDRVLSPPNSQSHDAAEAYQYSSKNVSIQRLSAIKTFVGAAGGIGGQLVKHYKLAYSLSTSTGRSLLQTVHECSDAAGARCLPPTRFTYRANSAPAFVERASFSLKTTLLLDANHQAGVLTGDFNGDGRTDIIRYHDDPANNQVYESDGTGQFDLRNSNLTAQTLFHSNGCYHSMVADFNGDGLSDILRVVAKNNPGCAGAGGSNLVLLSQPSGSELNFLPVALPSAVRLESIRSTTTYGAPQPCSNFNRAPATLDEAERKPASQAPLDMWFDGTPQSAPGLRPEAAPQWAQCQTQITTLGNSYYVVDVDADGFLDIVVAAYPDMTWAYAGSPPTANQICEGRPVAIHANSSLFGGPCTRLFKGSSTGHFTEAGTGAASKILYKTPPQPVHNANPYWVLPDLVDVDGDGLMDIRADSGTWRSLGNGDFTTTGVTVSSPPCAVPIDFNGDGRADCLSPSNSAATQHIRLAYGASWSNPVTTFNLGATPMSVNDSNGRQTIGVVIEDFDGDGRQDILRWSSTPGENEIYLSRGDGSFRSVGGASLLNMQIQRSDGARAVVLGDFVGDGTLQILRLAANPPGGLSGGVSIACYSLHCNDPPPPPAGISDTVYNMMLVRQGEVGPVDVLSSVTTSSGLTSTVESRVALTRGLHPTDFSGYEPDRGTAQAASGALVDLQPPMYVVTATSRQTGSGLLTTRYRYTGLKAERGGRGMLGFRRMQQSDTTPATPPALADRMTVVTDYVLQHPYIGVASRTRTFLGGFGSESDLLARESGTAALGQRRISLTENTYCEHAAPAGQLTLASFGSPCATAALVVRPYLLKTVEMGWDLTGTALPKVETSNEYNRFGDPTKITVKTFRLPDQAAPEFTKITENTFCEPDLPCAAISAPSPNTTVDDKWILGRLSRATVRSISPSTMLAASAGSAPNAAATKGAPPPGTPMAINPAVLQTIINLILED